MLTCDTLTGNQGDGLGISLIFDSGAFHTSAAGVRLALFLDCQTASGENKEVEGSSLFSWRKLTIKRAENARMRVQASAARPSLPYHFVHVPAEMRLHTQHRHN